MDVPPTAARSVGSPALRRLVLLLLLGLLVVALVLAAVEITRKGAGGDPLDKIQSMRHPAANAALDREEALGRAQDLVTRFNTYGPDLLDSAGKMPKYDALSEDMTSKFSSVFLSNSALAAATVKQTHVRRSAQVLASGVVSIDDDTAQVIASGVARFAYPNPKKKGTWIDFDPERFRYSVSLVKQHGQWLVDDLDDLDDGLPPLGESMGEQGQSGQQVPSAPPSLSGSNPGGGGR